MAREQPLQPCQADTGEHGNEQWLVCDRWRLCGQRVKLLRLDRQQLKRCCPDLTSSFCVGRKQMHPRGQLTGEWFDRRGTPNNGDQCFWIELPALEQGLNEGPGHAAQADHTESRLHGKLQRAAAPQAGEGALADSSTSATSASRLTTVGAEASS